MKILIGVKRMHVGEGFREERDFADEIHILAKGEKEVRELSLKIKSIKKVLAKDPITLFGDWTRKQLALRKKFGIEVFNIAIKYKLLMVTEAEVL